MAAEQPIDVTGTINYHEALERAQPVLETFGVTAHPGENPDEFFAQINAIDPRVVNGGNFILRQEIGAPKYPDEVIPLIYSAAVSLDMTTREQLVDPHGVPSDAMPVVGEHDAIVVVGAFGDTLEKRAAQAARDLAAGTATTGRFLIGTVSRVTVPAEIEVAQVLPEEIHLGPHPKTGEMTPTEISLGRAATRRTRENYPEVQPQPELMAVENSTADVATLVRRAAEITPGAGRLAIVVNRIYSASLGIEAQRVGRALGIEVRVASAPSDPAKVATRKPGAYLAEIVKVGRSAGKAILTE